MLEQRSRPTLTEAQVIELVRLGRRIEAVFGRPQDIEWCRTADGFEFVQSRPITTLFPVPDRDDDENHVYLSVGHQQMMTDAMKPLGLSFWQMTTPGPDGRGRRAPVRRPHRAGWPPPAGRDALLDLVGTADPLTGDALRTVLARDGFIRPAPGEDGAAPGPAPSTDASRLRSRPIRPWSST